MIPRTSPNHERPFACIPSVRTVALCDIDPAKFAVPPEGMPAGPEANVLMVLDCADAIHAAIGGEVDMLVLDGRHVSVEGLTALSFLRQERPDLPIYFFQESRGNAARLQPWDHLS